MKTTCLKFYVLAIALILLLPSCKKDNTPSGDSSLALTSPTNGTTNLLTNVVLTCAPVADAVTYRFTVVDANSSAYSTNVSVTNSSTFALSAGHSYTWSVTATDTRGKTYSSVNWSFATGAGGPTQADSIPVALAPVDGAQNVCTQSTFRWTAALGATSYQVEVDTSNPYGYGYAFSTPVSDTFYTMPAGALKPGTNYKLRIITSGIPYESSTLFSTTGAPTLLTPGNNAQSVGTSPTFTWSAQGCTSVYTIMISRAFNHSQVFTQTLTGTSYTIPSQYLNSGTTYVWSVKANGDNVYLSEFTFTP